MVRWQRTEVAKFGTGGEAKNFYLRWIELLKEQFPEINPQVFKLKWGTGQMAKIVFHMDFQDEEEMIENRQKQTENEAIRELFKSRGDYFIDGSTHDTTLITIESKD